jgi:hypothetical protein
MVENELKLKPTANEKYKGKLSQWRYIKCGDLE